MFLEPNCSLKNLSDAVLQLSNFFIDHPRDQTPWNEPYCKLAYRHYYFPLNYIRNQRVIEQGKNVNFFNHIEHTIDWGAGPGTASLALKNSLNLKSQLLIEKSTTALSAFKDIYDQLQNPTMTSVLDLKKISVDKSKTLLTLSYSLTEMAELPHGWDQFEALMIVEPSTRDDGRKLLQVRQKLIEAGYTIWAPCLHQKQCPLLIHSKSDWCHDRVHVQAPDWFKKLEEHMPFRNNTVTTSYLLARKQKPTFNTKNKIRMTGDSMEEKGKTRQLICRNETREFLTWMHKEIEPEIIPRGIVMDLPEKHEIKSNEIRVKK
jgi:ribosomal protein RSM22 (predicted rRNA methylase)